MRWRVTRTEKLEDRLALSASCAGEPDRTAPEARAADVLNLSTSRELGPVNQQAEVTGWVGWLDASDIYRFELDQDAKITIALSGLSADLDLNVYDSSGRRIGTSTNGWNRDESLSGELGSGIYYVRVYPAQFLDASSYRLTINSTSTPTEPARPPASPADPSEPSPGSETPARETTAPTPSEPKAPVVFPDVAYFGGQTDWSLNAIKAPEAWAQGYTGEEIIVAVIDTGVDLDHRDLDDNLWTNTLEIVGNGIDDDRNGYIDDVHGWDFWGEDNSPDDANGHGTHVAGIIAGERNSTGSTGIAYDGLIMPVQVLGTDGSGSMVDVAAGIRYAVDNGADIINLSLGSSSGSRTIQSALVYAEQHDVFVVAAAGNSGGRVPDYPARYGSSLSNVISVGAYSSQGAIAGFSNAVGSSGVIQVDAPGVGIYSAYSGNRSATLSGTSMAAPQVAGLAALTLAANPELTSAELRDLITGGADDAIRNSDALGGINAANTVAQAVGFVRSTRDTATAATANSRATTDATLTRFAARTDSSSIAAWFDAVDDSKRKRAGRTTMSGADNHRVAAAEQVTAIDHLMAEAVV